MMAETERSVVNPEEETLSEAFGELAGCQAFKNDLKIIIVNGSDCKQAMLTPFN